MRRAGFFHSPQAKENMRQARLRRREVLGYINSPETRLKISASQKGNSYAKGKHWKLSKEACENISLGHRGEKAWNWIGNIERDNNYRQRKSFEYAQWRKSVFQRDNYTCVFCGCRGGKLNADHILSFATHKEKRFDVSNGRTLCVPCHKATDTYAGRGQRRAKLTELKTLVHR